MTREELRKIFDDAEKEVLKPETYNKLVAELVDSDKTPADSSEGFSIRVNRVVEREFVFEVLAKILAAK